MQIIFETNDSDRISHRLIRRGPGRRFPQSTQTGHDSLDKDYYYMAMADLVAFTWPGVKIN